VPDVLTLLKQPAWWFTAVVVAVAVNLLTAYMKPAADAVGSRLWKSWANASSRRKELREERLALYRNDPQARIEAQGVCTYRLVEAGLFYLTSFLLLIGSSVIPVVHAIPLLVTLSGVGAIIGVVLAAALMTSAKRIESELKDAGDFLYLIGERVR
jgi:hypothetical protein